MMCIDSTFVVQSIRIADYEKENFQIGDIVLKVDNQDIRLLYDSLLQYVCGGNYWSNQSFGCNAVLSRNDSTTLFTLLRGSDTIRVKSVNRTAWDMHQLRMKKERENQKKSCGNGSMTVLHILI